MPLTDVLKLASWLMHEVVRHLLSTDDDVVSVKSNEGMKLTERGAQKISDAWGCGLWSGVKNMAMRC